MKWSVWFSLFWSHVSQTSSVFFVFVFYQNTSKGRLNKRSGDIFLIPWILSKHLCGFPSFLPLAELNTGQIQEGVGEAINGIVKHFHKPEKEVRDGRLDEPQHELLLFIANEERWLSAPVVSRPPSCCQTPAPFTPESHWRRSLSFSRFYKEIFLFSKHLMIIITF